LTIPIPIGRMRPTHHVFHRAAFPQVRGTIPHPTLTAMALGPPINRRVS